MPRALGFVPSLETAVASARISMPLKNLGWDVATLGETVEMVVTGGETVFDPAVLDGIDLVVFPQTVELPGLPPGGAARALAGLCDLARARGIPVVYSADDDVRTVEDDHPLAGRLRATLPATRAILAGAGAIVVTTTELAARFAGSGVPVHVVPNAIDAGLWRLRPRTSGEWRVGWAGGATHGANLLHVADALRELARRQPVRFFLFGLTTGPLEPLPEIAALVRELRAVHVPFGRLADYPARLAALDLDIGLCPLRDTRFNRAKSALKYYEYAAAGTLTIASRVTPFAEEVDLTVPDDPRAWADTIERMLRRRDEREAALAVQRAFVLRERTIAATLPLWRKALHGIL